MAQFTEPAGVHSGSDILWDQFVDSEDFSAFAASWLALLCSSVEGVTGALVLIGKPDQGPYAPVAVWPDPSCNLHHLVPAAEQALAGRHGVLLDNTLPENPAAGARHIAYPLEVSGKLHGVTVFELTDRPEPLLQAVMRQIHWGAAWLEILIRRTSADEDRSTIERLATLIELTARSVQYEQFHQVAMALVNELATRLQCDRVSLGVVKHRSVAVEAVSNTSKFLKRSNLIKATEAAMDEAVDQQSFIVSPAMHGTDVLVCRLHDEFVKGHEIATACTVPLPGRKGTFGALFFEKTGDQFEPATLELLRSMGYLLGPILETHWRQERWFTVGMLQSPLRLMRRLVGSEGFAVKAIVLAVAVVIAVLAVVETDHRVSAKTVVEGAVQRSLAAPFNGYIATADARASDIVRQGQVLCTLDNRDLALEKRKWSTVGEQYAKKYRQSMANHERATAQITDAQLQQARAEAALLEEKLTRARIVAPFDGVLISGDLHQRLGSPVQQGEELFKIAPLDHYRVVIQVDERDLANVKVHQKGNLILSSLPNDKFAFEVKRITPVSMTEEGRNFFRVEARLEQASDLLRPGMEGIGKITGSRRSLLWIWTHGIMDWLRLKMWSWMP